MSTDNKKVKIPLTKGYFAYVSACDAHRVSQTKWQAMVVSVKNKKYGIYAETRMKPYINGRGKKVYLHRFIVDAPKGAVVDHVDGDTLNNTRENLRLVSHKQNLMNRPKNSNNTTGYKGVSKVREGTYVVRICDKHVGTFSNKKEAALAYNKEAQKMFGDIAFANAV